MTAMISDSSPQPGGRTKPRERRPGREVLHGRTAEQKMVRDLLRRARRGAGGVVLVEGDPGIGRSWLLRDATDEAAELGFSLAAGAADQLGQTIPFFALRTALREPFAELTAMIPVMVCPPRPRGGLPRHECTSHSAPRRRRSWSAWMTCTGPARPRWPRCGRCRGTLNGTGSPGSWPGQARPTAPRITCSVNSSRTVPPDSRWARWIRTR